MCSPSLAPAFHQKHMEVRGERSGVKLPHHQRDLTSMISGMVRQMVHHLICVVRKGSIVSKDSFVTLFTNSICSFSTSSHLTCNAATLENACGLNRASRRVLQICQEGGAMGRLFPVRKQ